MPKVLVVDDEENIRALVGYALGNCHTVLEARNGLEGFYMFESHNPDLIITDLAMPIMTGDELVRRVRASNSKTWIIAVSSSFHEQEVKTAMLNAGADICLPKPVAVSFLEMVISNLLNLKRLDASSDEENLKRASA